MLLTFIISGTEKNISIFIHYILLLINVYFVSTDIHILDCVNTLPPSINSNFTLTTTKNGCLATFTCLPGYDVVKGDFTIDYNNADGKWNGTGVNCQGKSRV